MSTDRKTGADVLGLATPPRATTSPKDRPSLETARRRLGGQATDPSERPPGTLVQVAPRPLLGGPAAIPAMAGVLLWATQRHCDVWFEDGVARRAPADQVTPLAGPTSRELLCVAAEIRLFQLLTEGDTVCWERATEIAEGRIVEKCRYGAIVVMLDGKVVAVGFRKLWPASVRGRA